MAPGGATAFRECLLLAIGYASPAGADHRPLALALGLRVREVELARVRLGERFGRWNFSWGMEFEVVEFVFQLKLPLSLGTVGGLTQLHPLVKWSMELLGNPNAKNLMEIIAVAGLAQNFAAVKSLITSGIQKGHMKMHLLNILNQHEATVDQKQKALEFFKTHTITYSAVSDFLKSNT